MRRLIGFAAIILAAAVVFPLWLSAGEAAPLFRLRPGREPHTVPLAWRDTANAVALPGGKLAGKAYDTTLWSAGREALQAIAPALVVEGKATGAIPVGGDGFSALFVTVKANAGEDTKLAVYRIAAGGEEWSPVYEEVLAGSFALQQNDDGPVLAGDGVFYRCRVLDDGTVAIGEAASPAHWVHRLGDGTVVPAPDFAGLLGIRYDEASNNYLFALGEHAPALAGESPPAGEEEPPAETPATVITVGTAPAIYLDALLTSEVAPRVSGMELTAITVEGDFYCAGGGVCTRAEIVVTGGGMAAPLVVKGPGAYPVKGGIDEDLVVTMHLYPVAGATPAISAAYLGFEPIELAMVEREGPLDVGSGEAYVQFDPLHPRRLSAGGLLSSAVVEMPAPGAKLRSVFLDADLGGPLNVFALSAHDPSQVLAFRRVEEPGWLSLAGGVYEPFRLVVAVPADGGGATIRGLATRLTWQGIY
jgi:hypothetical protein